MFLHGRTPDGRIPGAGAVAPIVPARTQPARALASDRCSRPARPAQPLPCRADQPMLAARLLGPATVLRVRNLALGGLRATALSAPPAQAGRLLGLPCAPGPQHWHRYTTNARRSPSSSGPGNPKRAATAAPPAAHRRRPCCLLPAPCGAARHCGGHLAASSRPSHRAGSPKPAAAGAAQQVPHEAIHNRPRTCVRPAMVHGCRALGQPRPLPRDRARAPLALRGERALSRSAAQQPRAPAGHRPIRRRAPSPGRHPRPLRSAARHARFRQPGQPH